MAETSSSGLSGGLPILNLRGGGGGAAPNAAVSPRAGMTVHPSFTTPRTSSMNIEPSSVGDPMPRRKTSLTCPFGNQGPQAGSPAGAGAGTADGGGPNSGRKPPVRIAGDANAGGLPTPRDVALLSPQRDTAGGPTELRTSPGMNPAKSPRGLAPVVPRTDSLDSDRDAAADQGTKKSKKKRSGSKSRKDAVERVAADLS